MMTVAEWAGLIAVLAILAGIVAGVLAIVFAAAAVEVRKAKRR